MARKATARRPTEAVTVSIRLEVQARHAPSAIEIIERLLDMGAVQEMIAEYAADHGTEAIQIESAQVRLEP